MDYAQKALEMHRQWKGKIRVNTPCVLENKEDLSVAYTPGVAAPCPVSYTHLDVYKRQEVDQ